MSDDYDSVPVGSIFFLFINFINSNVLLYFFICKVISAEKGHYLPEFRVGFYFFMAVWYLTSLIPIIFLPIEQFWWYKDNTEGVPKCLKFPVLFFRTFVWFLPASLFNLLELSYIFTLGGGTDHEHSILVFARNYIEVPL